jgi:hypothetical protein
LYPRPPISTGARTRRVILRHATVLLMGLHTLKLLEKIRMTPAEGIIDVDPMSRPARAPTRRKRAGRPRGSTGSSAGGERARGKAVRVTESAPAQLRHKLADKAGQARSDASVGLIAFAGLTFAPTWVMLGSIGVDAVTGTSLAKLVEDWLFVAKGLAMVAGAAWALLFYVPAALFARLLKAQRYTYSPKRIRPIVNAVAVYVAVLVGVIVWNMPPLPGPPDVVVPGPEVHRAELAMVKLRLMALQCMGDASPSHCSRPDVLRVQARYYLKWLEEVPGVFEGRRSNV